MTALSITLPTVGGSEDTWGTTLNADLQAISDFIGPLDSTELAVLDGITATTAQLNATATFTAAGLALMDDVDAAAQRATLGLGTAATTAATAYATAAQSAAADAAAPLASPIFTGVPVAPTAAPATNTTQIATTAFVAAGLAAIPAPTAPTTTEVLEATAGATAGAVGTYAFMERTGNNAGIDIGETIAGSSIRYAGVDRTNSQPMDISSSSTVPSGTWRCMGYISALGDTSAERATLFLRIS